MLLHALSSCTCPLFGAPRSVGYEADATFRNQTGETHRTVRTALLLDGLELQGLGAKMIRYEPISSDHNRGPFGELCWGVLLAGARKFG